MSNIAVQEYARIESHYCRNNIEEFDTLDAAKLKCSNTTGCTMLYDQRGEGHTFRICGHPPDKVTSKRNSVLYVQGE